MKKILILTIILLITSCSKPRQGIVKSPVINDSKKIELTSNDPNETIGDDTPIENKNRVVEYYVNGLELKPINTPKSEPQIINTSNNRTQTINQGRISYKIPSEMNVRNTYQVVVRISKSEVSILEKLNDEIHIATIPISETMEVSLIDPSPIDSKMFDIIQNNKAEQIIDDESYTQWTWDITPLKTGTTNLKIIVSIIRNGRFKETVYEDSVKVHMDLGKQIPYYLGKYWQWLLTSMIIPFGVWFYNRKKKNKKTIKK